MKDKSTTDYVMMLREDVRKEIDSWCVLIQSTYELGYVQGENDCNKYTFLAMCLIIGGMAIAGVLILAGLPAYLGFSISLFFGSIIAIGEWWCEKRTRKKQEARQRERVERLKQGLYKDKKLKEE